MQASGCATAVAVAEAVAERGAVAVAVAVAERGRFERQWSGTNATKKVQ